MTGAVTWEVLIWVVGIVIAAGAVVAAFLFWVWRLVAGFNEKIEERDAAAQLEKERAKLAEETLSRELAEYKVHVAEKFATKDGVTQAVGRMEQAVERLTSQVHNAVELLTGRLDRLFEARSEGPRGRTGT